MFHCSINLYKFGFILVLPLLFSAKLNAQVEVDTNYVLEEVILSADKTATSSSRLQQNVQSISSKDMRLIQSQNMADLLQASGHVFVQRSQQGGGSPVVRGFEANKVLLVVDGVRLNNAIYRGGHLQNVITIDNQSLEKIEILNGPASNVYGSDALGGVIHMYTKKPVYSATDDLTINGGLSARYGTINQEKTGHFDLRIGHKHIASYTSVTASRFGDLRMGKRINPSYGKEFGLRNIYVENFNGLDSIVKNEDPYLQIASGYDQVDIIQKVLHKISNSLEHGLNFQYSNSTDVPRYDRLTDPSSSTILNQAQWYYGPQYRMMLAYDINKTDTNNKPKWHIGINYQDIEESRHNRRFGVSKLSSRIERIGIWGFTFDRFVNIGKHRINYGADGQYNDLVSKAFSTHISTGEVLPIDTRYPDGVNYMTNIGAYATHTVDINDRLTLNDGLRFGYTSLRSTFVNKTFFPFPFDEATQNSPTYSGSVGLVHRIGAGSKVGAGLASGFRVPNIDDLGKVFETSPTTLIVPNPDLQPEKTISAELNGVVQTKNKAFVWSWAVYNTWLQDAIAVTGYTLNGQSTIIYNGQTVSVLANQNVNRAIIYGVQSSAKYKWNEQWTTEWQFQYTHGELIPANEIRKPLDHIPPMTSRLAMGYNNGKFSALAFGLYNGWKRLEDYSDSGEDNLQYATQEGIPSWYTIHLKLSYNITKNASILGGIDNIADLQYRAFASGINGGGRNFSIAGRLFF